MFKERDKSIFGPYYNGQKQVHADPVRVLRELTIESGGQLKEVIDLYNGSDAVASAIATAKLIQYTTHAFDLTPFNPDDGTGVCDNSVLELLDGFFEWCKKKEESTASGPTTVPTTVAADPRTLTKNSSVCGLTVPDKRPEGRGALK